jgi:hypothetical protein
MLVLERTVANFSREFWLQVSRRVRATDAVAATMGPAG